MRAEPRLSHGDLVKKAATWLRTKRCGLIVCEASAWSTREFPDAIGWRPNGYSVLVECKVSRADFQRDKVKPSRLSLKESMGRERWYLAPQGLLRASDMPTGYGLIETDGGPIRIVWKAATDERPGRESAELPLLINQARHRGWELKAGRIVVQEQAPKANGHG